MPLYLSEPYSRVCNSNSSFIILKEDLKQVIYRILSIYCKKRAMQEKVVSCFSL